MNPGEELPSWESCEAEHCPRIAIPAPGTSVTLLSEFLSWHRVHFFFNTLSSGKTLSLGVDLMF